MRKGTKDNLVIRNHIKLDCAIEMLTIDAVVEKLLLSVTIALTTSYYLQLPLFPSCAGIGLYIFQTRKAGKVSHSPFALELLCILM